MGSYSTKCRTHQKLHSSINMHNATERMDEEWKMKK